MGSLVVVAGQPSVKVGLQLIEAQAEPLSECNLIELLQDGFVKAFAETVRLWMARPGFGVLKMSLSAK
jgi:hypothetical protein